ncbi:MAG: ISL3 family transposase [Cyclobacteriaceae bacterium]
MATSASCPKCGNLSSRQHSRYRRKLADLPWAGKPVTVYLQLQRFFCDHSLCPQKTFALPLASIFRYARQTSRLQYQLLLIASQLGGRAGARLASLLGMPTSRDILLRLLMQQPQDPLPPPKVLGVDDWSLKKGTTYATILVDIEKQRPIELLPGREAETLATWLKHHPGVEVITRDRASSYAEGASKGAPNALQVADRWHLLKNLGEALKRMLEKHTVQLITSARELAETQQQVKHQEQIALSAQTEVVGPSVSLSSATATYALRFYEAKRLLSEGYSMRAVSRMLSMSRKTIDRYRHLETYPGKSFSNRSSTVLPRKKYLIERWNAGTHNRKQLWLEIRAQGFTGNYLCVQRFFAHFKGAEIVSLPELEIKNWSSSRVQFLLSKPQDQLTEEEQKFLKVFFHHCPQAKLAQKLALDFHAIFREKRAQDLQIWIRQAKTSGITALKNFATGLESDYAAVEAAATYAWSNGPVEGHVNRLKLIKRQMFGRAGFELLRKRVLFYPDTG